MSIYVTRLFRDPDISDAKVLYRLLQKLWFLTRTLKRLLQFSYINKNAVTFFVCCLMKSVKLLQFLYIVLNKPLNHLMVSDHCFVRL